MNLIALPFSNFYDNPYRTIQELNNVWQNMRTDPNIDPDGLELIETMSKEIAADFSSECEYIRIANFVNYLLTIYNKTKDVDGIIYPSVPAQGAGFNVALKIDNLYDKIRFENAGLCHLLKRKEKMYLPVMAYAQRNENSDDLTYIRRQLSEPEIIEYAKRAEGLKFVN